MSDNHDLIFDFHEHHDTGHHYAVTHQHDQHPRHHHDRGGSVIYLHDTVDVVDRGFDQLHYAHLLDIIGAGGNDIHSRTTPADTDVP